jgi:serine/threonine protein phosphatase 1
MAIGDIHGHRSALQGLIRKLDLRAEDKLVFLGDYINRGPDSRGVVDELLELQRQYDVVLVMGNHEQALIEARHDPSMLGRFLATCESHFFDSYECMPDLDVIPAEHWEFFDQLQDIHVEQDLFFTHANYAPNMALDSQPSNWLRWCGIDDHRPSRHYSGKTGIVGHTPQMNKAILDLGHCIGIDTGCGMGGVLTALDVNSREIYQVDEQGNDVETDLPADR